NARAEAVTRPRVVPRRATAPGGSGPPKLSVLAGGSTATFAGARTAGGPGTAPAPTVTAPASNSNNPTFALPVVPDPAASATRSAERLVTAASAGGTASARRGASKVATTPAGKVTPR